MDTAGLGLGGVNSRVHTPGMDCLSDHLLDYTSTHPRRTLGLILLGWILWSMFSPEWARDRYLGGVH